jgi:large subunit ribosomal protein L1
MMKRGKRYAEALEKVDGTNLYTLAEAVEALKGAAYAKFDESVEFAARLNVDPKKADQQVRGTVVLPHGTGRTVRILVLTRGEKEKEAQEAGADHVGSDEYINKIKEGWAEFDVAIATPDIMSEVGKLGKILGPRGLMPNPKSGTVTFDVAKAVGDAKAGKVEYRVDRAANIHVAVGKVSFPSERLVENARTLLGELLRAKPAAAKGQYIKSMTLSSTMGPGIRIDHAAEVAAMKM